MSIGVEDVVEQTVGLMVEGRYGWREYCLPHAQALLNIRPGANRRTIGKYEVDTSWRPYRCASCGRILRSDNTKAVKK